tara:strand:+ start:149 stop:337 length:189 start_codon:yes stop_codon:yes gene_type:complete
MAKKCIICDAEAVFLIKGSNESYCDGCAKENFSDLTLLQTVEEEAAKVKQIIKEKTKQEEEP